MRKVIIAVMLLGFCACIFSSFMIVKAKVKANEPSFIITKTCDLKTKEARKLINPYNVDKNYYWKYSIQRTYHASNWRIYVSQDTISREIKEEVN